MDDAARKRPRLAVALISCLNGGEGRHSVLARALAAAERRRRREKKSPIFPWLMEPR